MILIIVFFVIVLFVEEVKICFFVFLMIWVGFLYMLLIEEEINFFRFVNSDVMIFCFL